ncbi:hypothetical protein SJAG_03885 [Schizosaccharomyces japonicus yFS275]|uniref:Uncharacterized protein n=1 Tax=Schizosaccharomyces japonicus (strain yFS275 / FY16936) TaxID=402676 RepID=B6K5B5_SCHJY|nr:hypothetical protein SJAG_03885 [Schizosaccharomyces japonicus yFS275]EEB08719.1 hypothetical protein SJAG_03885 [Schizosaccharomyces japonicus yFS275]
MSIRSLNYGASTTFATLDPTDPESKLLLDAKEIGEFVCEAYQRFLKGTQINYSDDYFNRLKFAEEGALNLAQELSALDTINHKQPNLRYVAYSYLQILENSISELLKDFVPAGTHENPKGLEKPQKGTKSSKKVETPTTITIMLTEPEAAMSSVLETTTVTQRSAIKPQRQNTVNSNTTTTTSSTEIRPLLTDPSSEKRKAKKPKWFSSFFQKCLQKTFCCLPCLTS